MAAEDRGFRTRDDASSIALLSSIRSGVADFSFVHRADVCSAAPADLVANLEPVPGTDLDKGGYNAIWYLYCPKRFKNAKGDHSGHRQRSIAGGDTCWHSESSPKPVKGLDGATVRNLSYGRKEGSSRSFNRMGWCMLEYDDQHGGGGDDHVLCKIYRSSSSLARAKSKPTNQRLSGCKRKATSDHAQSLPSKMSHAQACSFVDLDFLDHVQQPLFTDDKMAMLESLFPAEEEQFQHNTQPLLPAEEQQFLQHNTQSLLPAEEQQFQFEDSTRFTIGELLGYDENVDEFMMSRCCGTPTATAPPDAGLFEGLAF
uniref:NAC domain-containing protein n=1 Tax=Setaria viridis TaxID=4556 RepID=A0A4V6D0C9_SETVI|nr:hypothetical protein SEVIR_9G028700v2 [Setaria viridis]